MSNARYGELSGRLVPAAAGSHTTPPAPSVVLSTLTSGAARSPAWQGLSVRYVARGTEVYRIAGRTYRLREGELMLASQALGGEAEIPGRSGLATVGLCLFFPGEEPCGVESAAPSVPVIVPASCSSLGSWLAGHVVQLTQPSMRPVNPGLLLESAAPHVTELAAEVARHVDAVAGARTRTRWEAVRRVYAARAHLHETVGRSVSITELARVAGLSAFQLARTFRDCFGVSPARYHRILRMDLVRREVERGRATWQQCATSFGFASASSFSHAWRRAFGSSPRASEPTAIAESACGG